MKTSRMSMDLTIFLSLFIATQPPTTARPHPLPDLEAVGRLRNLGYEHIDIPEDAFGHGWVTAEFRISRVLRGRTPSRSIIVRYLGHTYRSENFPIRLRLRANKNGTFTVCAEPGGEGLVCG